MGHFTHTQSRSILFIGKKKIDPLPFPPFLNPEGMNDIMTDEKEQGIIMRQVTKAWQAIDEAEKRVRRERYLTANIIAKK